MTCRTNRLTASAHVLLVLHLAPSPALCLSLYKCFTYVCICVASEEDVLEEGSRTEQPQPALCRKRNPWWTRLLIETGDTVRVIYTLGEDALQHLERQ